MIKLEIAEYFFKLNGHIMLEIITFITRHEPPKQFLLQIKIIVSELIFLMIEILQLYPLLQMPMLEGLQNGLQNVNAIYKFQMGITLRPPRGWYPLPTIFCISHFLPMG